jgi:putative flippase GtrA
MSLRRLVGIRDAPSHPSPHPSLLRKQGRVGEGERGKGGRGLGPGCEANRMIPIDRVKASFPRAAALVEPHFDVLRKAISFALIGVINVVVDASVFFLTYSYLRSDAAALRLLDGLAQSCACTNGDTLLLVTANLIAWVVAVSGSYVMNSFITFAAESGRRLRWLDYGAFVASGVLGVIANTTALVIAARFMPVLPAKGCSILTAFMVNFSMSHFVVFRPRRK